MSATLLYHSLIVVWGHPAGSLMSLRGVTLLQVAKYGICRRQELARFVWVQIYRSSSVWWSIVKRGARGNLQDFQKNLNETKRSGEVLCRCHFVWHVAGPFDDGRLGESLHWIGA